MFQKKNKVLLFQPRDIPIIFMGTSVFGVPALETLVHKGYDIRAVITRPDKPVGRGHVVQESPIAQCAKQHQLAVIKPNNLDNIVISQILSFHPFVIIVVAYGKIIPKKILKIPLKGCVNIHPSLLPDFRGPSPIQTAILQRKQMTGVTLMLLDEGMDSGPILSQKSIRITKHATAGMLHDQLSILGAKLLIQTLLFYLDGKIKPQAQLESNATFCRKIQKEDGLIDWSRDSVKIDANIRAFSPWPGAYTYWPRNIQGQEQDQYIKIIRAHPKSASTWRRRDVGMVRINSKHELEILCGRGSLIVDELQLPGKKPLAANEFVKGAQDFIGAFLS